MKIVYCVGSLSGKGGTEKVLANKTSYFINSLKYEVHIIIEDQGGFPLCYDFNKKITFHDMQISKLNYIKIKGITFIKNIFTLRKLYTKKIQKINPDVIVVCERGYHDFVIPFIISDIPKVREFHSSRKAIALHASLMKPWYKKKIHTFRYNIIFKMFNKYDYLVLLTRRDMEEGGYKTNLSVIPNMNTIEGVYSAKLKNKRAISVGSMNGGIKRFDLQINLWNKIIKKHPNWILDIYGDGYKKKELQLLINKLDLNENVILHGNSNTIFNEYEKSSIFLFTSIAEGLPMVLIEALSLGIPCVSFNCPTGPNEIITNNVDGFLIEEGDIQKLEEKILLLIENESLRIRMGTRAKNKSRKFLPSSIGKKWELFFQTIKQ